MGTGKYGCQVQNIALMPFVIKCDLSIIKVQLHTKNKDAVSRDSRDASKNITSLSIVVYNEGSVMETTKGFLFFVNKIYVR